MKCVKALRIFGVICLLSPAPAFAATGTDLLQQALSATTQQDWDRADALAGQMSRPEARDIILWSRLRGSTGTWAEYQDFISRNPDWPGLDALRRAGEYELPGDLSVEELTAWFDGGRPQTGTGTLRLADALIRENRVDEAEREVIRGWLEHSLSRPERLEFLERWGALLKPHHVARLDMLLWRGHTGEAEVMLPYVDADWQKLARARIATRRDTPGLQLQIMAVPKYLAANPGLAYERYLYRTKKGRWDDAEAFILQHSKSLGSLGRPDEWMPRRANLARQAMRRGEFERAYAIASRNYGSEGWSFADSEWVAGFIALTFLDAPEKAAEHFTRFREVVATPISLGRAGYWQGLAFEAAGDDAAAQEAFTMAAGHFTSFYGQLAANHVQSAPKIALSSAECAKPNTICATSSADRDTYSAWKDTPATQTSVVKAAWMLSDAGYDSLATRFLTHASEGQPAEIRAQIAQMAIDSGLPHIGVRIAKQATRDGIVILDQYYPLHPIANTPWPVPTEFALAIARQESEFNHGAESHAGALGLMQLMPATASQVSASISVNYSKSRLLSDPSYNARLGTEYLSRMLKRFDGSEPLAAAAYNAGPSRVSQWLDEYGDPRKGEISMVTWMEMIPYNETRNYVQRVMEGIQVYRMRLGENPEPIVMASETVTRGGQILPPSVTRRRTEPLRVMARPVEEMNRPRPRPQGFQGLGG